MVYQEKFASNVNYFLYIVGQTRENIIETEVIRLKELSNVNLEFIAPAEFSPLAKRSCAYDHLYALSGSRFGVGRTFYKFL